MGKDGSAPRAALPASLGPAVVGLGWLAMMGAGLLSRNLGLRPALLVSELFLSLPALLALFLFRVPIAEGLALRRPDGPTTLLSLLAGAAFWGASLGLLEVQYAVWRPPGGYLEAFRRLHDALRPSGLVDALLSVAAIALAPALFEEIVFRGTVLPAFLRSFAAPVAVVASAFLFGLIHLDFTTPGATFYRVPFAFAVGLGLGTLRARTGSLFPPVLAHALLNTITFVSAPFTEDPSGALPDARPLLGAAILAVGTVVAVLALRRLDSSEGAS